jgi:hypothetical protein
MIHKITVYDIYTQNIWFIKADTSLCDSFPGTHMSTQGVGSV